MPTTKYDDIQLNKHVIFLRTKQNIQGRSCTSLQCTNHGLLYTQKSIFKYELITYALIINAVNHKKII